MAIDFHFPRSPVTDEELMRISRENPDMRFERDAQGKLIAAPPVGMMGSFGELELALQVRAWAQRSRQGRVTGPDAGFTLPDGSVRAPDAAWTSQERLNALSTAERQGYAHIAPMLSSSSYPLATRCARCV